MARVGSHMDGGDVSPLPLLVPVSICMIPLILLRLSAEKAGPYARPLSALRRSNPNLVHATEPCNITYAQFHPVNGWRWEVLPFLIERFGWS